MEENKEKHDTSDEQNLDVKRHLTPEDDERLHAAYINALGEILENDDNDARDSMANYMDEVREESEALDDDVNTDEQKEAES